MAKLKKIAAVTGALLAAGYAGTAAADPWAIADSYLRIYNFTIMTGNNNGGSVGSTALNLFDPTFNPGGTVRIDSVKTNVNLKATFSTGASTQGLVPDRTDSNNFVLTNLADVIPPSSVCANATQIGCDAPGGTAPNQYVQYDFFDTAQVPLNTPPAGSFAGGANQSSGNAIIDATGGPGGIPDGIVDNPDNIPMHSQVSLLGSDLNGVSEVDNNFTTQFRIQFLADTRLELSFLADGFLRSALGQNDVNAAASFNWTLALRNDDTGSTILNWAPNGVTGDLTGGTEYADGLDGTLTEGPAGESLDLQSSRSTNGFPNGKDFVFGFTGGNYEIERTLAAGSYTLTIVHKTKADATTPVVIPEPASLALAGLGLLGVGVASRRRKA